MFNIRRCKKINLGKYIVYIILIFVALLSIIFLFSRRNVFTVEGNKQRPPLWNIGSIYNKGDIVSDPVDKNTSYKYLSDDGSNSGSPPHIDSVRWKPTKKNRGQWNPNFKYYKGNIVSDPVRKNTSYKYLSDDGSNSGSPPRRDSVRWEKIKK